MNPVVVRLTFRTLLGARRVFVLAALPLVLVALATLVRLVAGADDASAGTLTTVFGLGTLMPLIGLIVGTGVIGPEIGDGSIIYLLSKPLSRWRIVVSKLVAAATVVVAFGAFPIYVVGVMLGERAGGIALAGAVAAAAAGIAYSALFLLLAIVTRNAVVLGLLYALVWESLVGTLVPGARALSVQQWALAIAERLLDGEASWFNVSSAVDLSTGIIGIVVATLAATMLASRQLDRVTITAED